MIYVLIVMLLIFIGFILIKCLYKPKEIEKYKNGQDRFEECPPFYPNGWLPILESSELKKSEVKSVFGFGNDLVIFRGVSGKVYVFDAYCPHLGAHLGVGGTVDGESIRCPFHGWTFNNEGKCQEIPGINAEIKRWISHEINGFIYVWNNSKSETPESHLEPIHGIVNKEYIYSSKSHIRLNTYIQDYFENASDLSHIAYLHFAKSPLDINKNEIIYTFLNLVKVSIKYTMDVKEHNWRMTNISKVKIGPWTLSTENKYSFNSATNFVSEFIIFGQKYSFMQAEIISFGPTKHMAIFHYYRKANSILAFFCARFMKYVTENLTEEDIPIWNYKKYLAKPPLTENDKYIKMFRRWYKQFLD